MKQTVILDSTQISAFLECERIWQFAYRENLTLTAAAPKIPMAQGTYGHKLLELYYKAKASGCDTTAARLTALEFKLPEDFPFKQDSPEAQIVRKRFNEYIFTYLKGDITPINSEAIELGFSHKLYEDEYYLFILEGKIDLIGEIHGIKCFMDHKFQARRHDLYSKSVQFRNYALVTGYNTAVINYIRLTKEVTGETYQRSLASFTSHEMRCWKDALIGIFRRVADSIYEQPKPNWSACSGKYNYNCEFTSLCEELLPLDNSLIKAKKETLYQIKQEWKPW